MVTHIEVLRQTKTGYWLREALFKQNKHKTVSQLINTEWQKLTQDNAEEYARGMAAKIILTKPETTGVMIVYRTDLDREAQTNNNED